MGSAPRWEPNHRTCRPQKPSHCRSALHFLGSGKWVFRKSGSLQTEAEIAEWLPRGHMLLSDMLRGVWLFVCFVFVFDEGELFAFLICVIGLCSVFKKKKYM